MTWNPLDDGEAPAEPTPALHGPLLAVDLGLRTGLALFDGHGKLAWARTRHLSSRTRLRAAIDGLLREMPAPEVVVVEGDPELARMWRTAAEQRGARVMKVAPERWRDAMLLPRDCRDGATAKVAAARLATQMMSADGRPPDVPLRHDAAEAVLIGLWALDELGWRPRPKR